MHMGFCGAALLASCELRARIGQLQHTVQPQPVEVKTPIEFPLPSIPQHRHANVQT